MKKNSLIIFTIITMLLLANFKLMAIERQAKPDVLKASFLKKQFSLRAGLNMFSGNGAESDYLTGINDFPVTPAYTAPVFGIAMAFFTSPAFAIGFDARYGFAAKVDLRDPTDGETIQVDTAKNLIAALSLFKFFDLSKPLQLLISLGAGVEYRMAEDKEYSGSLGTKIIISAPAKPISPLATAGIGLQYMLSAALGINLEGRATYIIRTPAQIILSPTLALVFKF